MWKTVLFLLITLVILPLLAFMADVPLTQTQKETLKLLILIYVFTAALCFVASTLTNNHSQVDKLWSVMPVVYVWVMTFHSDFEPRLLVMALLVTLWGARLSFNFGRRGGYSIRIWDGHEDYRWAVLQKKPEFKAKWKWMLFNLLFISFYQMALILLFTLPALRSAEGRALSWWDAAVAALLIFFLTIETIADQQQWNYHKEKNRLIREGEPLPDKYARGFVHHGLWKLVRHPNYASEQAIWMTFYLFSIIATGQWLNWSIIGCLLLVLLFWGSSNFSESISLSKYPSYSEYIKNTPRFVPLNR